MIPNGIRKQDSHMKTPIALLVSFFIAITCYAGAFGTSRAAEKNERAFDSGWRFLRADVSGAEVPGFDDAAWRLLDVPHDWSIEDLPSTNSAVASPFSATLSAGGVSTGYAVGGTGWYRKHFTLAPSDSEKNVSVCFDGVYMNADVWLNGQHLGNHPYGYTSFVYDLTPYLKPVGQENVLAVQVKNIGKNSRWYSGSGIYRHVRLAVTDPVHIPFWGVHVETPDVSKTTAKISVSTAVENGRDVDVAVRLRTRLVSPNGKTANSQESEVRVPAGKQLEFAQEFTVNKPVLWSLDTPALYRAEVELVESKKTLDRFATNFGIRTLRFSVEKGFELNGETVKLKGGCMHHDNGPLGSVTIDRAEERRVQLMKAYGFNAIRTSHNPPSPAFLDACDRYGVLVMDEAFDYWEEGKNPDDYGKNFNDWWQRDLAAMILRDRNHPSIIMWSIGNEIPQRGKERGYVIAKELRDETHRLNPSRPVTEAICALWDGRPWSATENAFSFLDIGGYNYQWQQYVPDHAKFPSRIMVGTESYPKDLYENWQAVLKNSWVLGDFVWTSWDYLGETGLG
ncbi:TPA: glycoside hydrolase family 2, partial [Candidatus Sumerlaeota bacterium]|nr:glycoside hydrolase family 2 [Candidatus Sumerlaeota bacterium]